MSDEPRLPDHIATIPDGIAYWAEQTPNAPALRAPGGLAFSHRELYEAVNRVAHQLVARGVSRQDRVALVLPAGVDMCVALLGIMAGAVAAPLSPALSPPELTRDLARLRPHLIVTGGHLEATTRDVATRLALPVMSITDLLALAGVDQRSVFRHPATRPDHIAVIQHTSGTTSLPKRAPRTHGSYAAAVRVARDSLHLTPDDVLLLTAGAHHNLGLADLLASLLSGGSCVITGGFDPRSYPDVLRGHKPTWAVLTPYELALLLDDADATGRDDITGPESRLRAVLAEAQALPPALLTRAERRLRSPVLTGYGMTEAGNIAKYGVDDRERREGSCGRSRCLEIRVVDASGQDVSTGATGEIVVRGPTVFAGYLDDPEATAAVFLPGGWFRTGDRGHLDHEGYLYLTGRLSETINRGGEKISPGEVECVLEGHPAVAEAAVFPIPHARLGEDLVAAVVLKPGAAASPRVLREWMLGQLSPFKVPRHIWIVGSLPRTPTGKVQRVVLAERFLE